MSTDLIIAMICLAIFGGYVATSLLLLRFPTLIHEKKKSKFRCRHISHRGGAGENLENTMTAFRHAREVGTEMLEIDCHLTKDGEVVVSHDNDLSRSAGLNVLISETNFRDLPPIRKSLSLDFYRKHTTQGGEDRQIPLLRDVFENFPGMPINIDIKIDDDKLINKVSELTRAFNREDITVWGNRSSHIVTKCCQVNPNMPVLFSLNKVLYTTVLFYTGLLPFIPIKESFYEILMPNIALRGQFQATLSWKFRLLIRIFDFLLMSKTLFRHFDRRGIQVYLWVLNDEEDFDRAFRLGATGVMTDFPNKLTQFLEKHPEYVARSHEMQRQLH